MRTNVVIDDDLMESALKASGMKTKKELRTFEGNLNGPATLTRCGWINDLG